MIEYCTKKVMVGTIATLILISVMILFFEDTLSAGPLLKDKLANIDSNASKKEESKFCIYNEKYQSISKCQPCSSSELKIDHNFCKSTGYKQEVKCDKSGKMWVPCSGDQADLRRHFFIFEGLVTLIGMASYLMVFSRQKRLDRLLMEKVNKQISAGV